MTIRERKGRWPDKSWTDNWKLEQRRCQLQSVQAFIRRTCQRITKESGDNCFLLPLHEIGGGFCEASYKRQMVKMNLICQLLSEIFGLWNILLMPRSIFYTARLQIWNSFQNYDINHLKSLRRLIHHLFKAKKKYIIHQSPLLSNINEI